MTTFYIFDIIGTFVFGLSGAFRAVKHEMDVLGVLLLAAITGTGGGIIRDLILGETPPAAFRNDEYIWVCFLAAGLAFFFAPRIAKHWPIVKTLDAIGLGVFAAIGSTKALDHEMGFLGVVFCGTITAVGGGVIRDVLTEEIPAILKTGFYATSAITGSMAMFFLHRVLDHTVAIYATAAITTTVRLLTWRYNVNLPRIKKLKEPPPQEPPSLTRIKKLSRTDNPKL